jgi:phosphate transport system permease protein
MSILPKAPSSSSPGSPEEFRLKEIFADDAGRKRLRLWRRIKDSISKYFVAIGGISVIVALGLIFLYLFSEVLPTMLPASMQLESEYPAPGGRAAATLHLAMDRHMEAGVRFDAAGGVAFFNPRDGRVTLSDRLPIPEGVGITSSAGAEPRTRLLAFGLSDGTAILVKHRYLETYPDDVRLVTPELEFPFDAEPVVVDEEGQPLVRLAVQEGPSGSLLAAVTADGRMLLASYETRTSFMTGEVIVSRSAFPVELPIPGDRIFKILIAMDLRTILVADSEGDLFLLNALDPQRVYVEDFVRVVPNGVELTAVEFLLGTVSIIAGGSDGGLTQWFPVRDPDNVRRLTRIREFEPHSSPVRVIQPAYARKGFATADEDGDVRIHFSTSHRTLASLKTSDRAIGQIAKAPRGNGILTADAAETVRFLEVDNEYPQASFYALWQKVWYEGYPEPDYVWQSSSATDEFEGKFSLVPLTVGTLKGAFYAMLFAIPLAILGAFYSAYFMTPKMRGFVKPTIEIMEALPTVILGFLAGLWFAPFVENHLPAVFSVLVVMPAAMLLFAFLWSFAPGFLRTRIPDGWEAALLIPVVLASGWLCIWLSPHLEIWFFGGDMRQWMTDQGYTYDQRNALVVGVAMGFAVIPTIFSIAEDAVFNVPRHLTHGSLALGATPWQTVVRVVALTASPGIFSAVMIGLGRAVGETMIVLMATGNSPVVNFNIFEGMRTLSANIAVEMPEAEAGGTHYRILFLAALVLFILTFIFNTAAEIVRQRLRRKYASL